MKFMPVMNIVARSSLALTACIFPFLAGCSSSIPARQAEQAQRKTSVMEEADAPDAEVLPKGLIEWVDYVCSIPDPEAKKQAIRDSEEQRGWTFTCPATY
jgi:PBP1b-binding outer membrane lipoprotein LpoB